MIIDKLAYNSKLRNIAPISKLLFSMSVLVICIWANSFLVSVFTALTMLFLIIFIGKTSYKNVFHLMTVPIVFIIMGSAAIAISIGQNSGDMLFSLHFGNTYFGVSHTSLLSAVRVMIKCFGAVSCMYFLSLTTPMVDLFTLLRKSIIPNFIIEIAELIYRYIFVLFDVSHRIHTAQDARLGYSNLRVSYHSTAQLASNLFIRSFNQAEKTYTAMESRGYDGEINFVNPSIDETTGTLKLRAVFPNPESKLVPGQFVRLVLEGLIRKDAIVVPQEAVMQGPNGSVVYRINSQGIVEAVPVQVGLTTPDGSWIIDKGLNPGDTVIVNGIMKVRPGAPAKAEIKELPVPEVPVETAPAETKPVPENAPAAMDNVRSYVTEKAAAPETVDDGVLAVEEAEPAEETNVIVLEEIPADEDVTETEDDGNSADAGVYTDKVLTRTEYDDFIAG